MWYRYVEYLRANHHVPDPYWGEGRDLEQWFAGNLEKFRVNMPNNHYKSFEKIVRGGEIYNFYVGDDSKESINRLKNLGFDSPVDVDDSYESDFQRICQYYKDFCLRMERHPWTRKPEENNLATWYITAKEDFRNSKLTDREMKLFGDLFKSVKNIRDFNNPSDRDSIVEDKRTKETAEKEEYEKFHQDVAAAALPSSREAHWYEMYNKYTKYIEENNYVPTQTKDGQLYHWIHRQRLALEKGDMSGERKILLKRLLERVSLLKAAMKKEVDAGNNIFLEKPRKRNTKSEHASQKDLWNQKWQAYMDYMARNKRRPSKHHAENMVLFDWYKHSKKLLNQGRMQPDRIAKFKLLLGEAKEFQRVNQHDYVNPEIKVDLPVIRLYDYQADMKRRIEDAFLSNGSVMVQMPTGTGKTHVIALVVRDFVKDGMG